MNKVMYPQVQPYIDEALFFFNYRIMLCPNGETLLLHIVIALYHYCFGHICTCIALYQYRYRKIGSIITSLSYCFCNIGTVIAFISYNSRNIGIVIAS